MNTRSRFTPAALVAGLGSMVVAGSAAAADVTAVTGAIDAAATPIAAIGAAVLLILVGVKVYKWIRRAL